MFFKGWMFKAVSRCSNCERSWLVEIDGFRPLLKIIDECCFIRGDDARIILSSLGLCISKIL